MPRTTYGGDLNQRDKPCGELGVILINVSPNPYVVKRGDRIAQAVIAPVLRATWREVEALSETRRGAGGFGSTGI